MSVIKVTRGGTNKRARLTIQKTGDVGIKMGLETDETFVIALASEIVQALDNPEAAWRGDVLIRDGRARVNLRPPNRDGHVTFMADRRELVS